MIHYTPPSFQLSAFNCPLCGIFSKQDWLSFAKKRGRNFAGEVHGLTVARCTHCKKASIWLDGVLLYPLSGSLPLANNDLPDEIKRDYEKARSIVNLSPRGAAALLRLAIQKLCKHLGECGDNLNQDIKALVQKGLPERIQQALDIARVIGNEAIHPGQIDLNDDPEMAQILFSLVNIIAEKMITEPKQIKSLFSSLPQAKREQIAKRDSK